MSKWTEGLESSSNAELKELLQELLYSEMADDDCIETIAEWAQQTGMLEALQEKLDEV